MLASAFFLGKGGTSYLDLRGQAIVEEHLIKREAGWAKDSHNLNKEQRGEELEEASNIFKKMRERGRSSDEIFTAVRATAANKISLFNRPEQAGRKRAWQEVDTLVKWSQSKNRRKAQKKRVT